MSRYSLLVIALSFTFVSLTAMGCSTTGPEDTITITELMKTEFHDQPTEAQQKLQRQCEDHDIDACVEWGELLASQPATGRHSPDDEESTVEVPREALETPMETLRKLCDDEVEEACVKLAFAAMMGFDNAPDPERAEKLHAASCQRGHLHACTNLAYHRVSDGEYSKAMQLYRNACDNDHPTGCLGLAKMHEHGFGTDSDLDLALEFYDDVCDQGVTDGCTNAGRLLAMNPDTEQKGYQMLEDSCVDGDDAGACTVLGLQLRSDPDEVERSRKMFERACDGDDFYGCDHLGSHYMQQATTPQDFDRGLESLERSCEMGSAFGCQAAAAIIHHGYGTGSPDHARAAQIFAVGCGIGAVDRPGQSPTAHAHIMNAAADCCTFLGTMFYEGRGVSRLPVRADDFLMKGCERGSEEGCIQLSTYLIQEGSPAGRQRAETILEQACDDEMGRACYVLATGLADGYFPSSPTPDRIREIYRRGCDLDDTESCNALQRF